MPLSSRPAAATDLALLGLRLVLGVVMVAHGWQKWTGGGFAGAADGFAAMGVPLPEVAGPFALVVELVGGIAILLGLLTPLFAVAFAATMAGAIAFVHAEAGFYAADGGYELVLLLGVVALVVAVAGPGRLSLDGVLGRRRAARETVAA